MGVGGNVAKPQGAHPGMVEQGFGHDPRRVGQVEQDGPGSQALDIASDLQRGSHRAQRAGKSARAGGLVADQAQAHGSFLIAHPGSQPTHPDLQDDEVGPGDGLFAAGQRAHLDRFSSILGPAGCSPGQCSRPFPGWDPFKSTWPTSRVQVGSTRLAINSGV